MYPREVLELIHRRLLTRDTQLVFELARRSYAHTELVLLDLLLFKVIERVRAARVCPHVGERDLLARALLEQQLPIARSEHECGERAVQKALVDVLH